MIPDNILAEAWIAFLNNVESARRDLRCSRSAAWFRGHISREWSLAPSLFRYGIANDPDDRVEIERRQRSVALARTQWNDAVESKANARKKLSAAKEDAVIQEAYRRTTVQEKELKTHLSQVRQELVRFQAPVNGERELFDEFIFRAAKAEDVPSWVILAEMRHHGVPTRLLDWTDRLDIAIYFALSEYRSAVEGNYAIDELTTPCIWVMNPFLLAERATGRRAIWSLTRERDYDYYSRFLRERTWPFDEPMPIYPPASIDRVQSQRGYFTVFGNVKESLEVQLSSGLKCIRRIDITREAALFAVDYLARVQGLSPFEVYRDLDSLGRELTQRLIRIQAP